MSLLNQHSESLEDAVLRYTGRGMNVLKPLLPEDSYHQCACRILQCEHETVLIATGFYVGGMPETDGPPGALCLAKTLASLGFHPVVVTDELCRGLFENDQIDVRYIPLNADDEMLMAILKEYSPSLLISVERCGKNTHGQYANMKGVNISEYTAPIDRLFELASEHWIYTIGIGDGGNEIGMGNLRDTIESALKLDPCIIKTDDLLIATTSNWGAYALCAALVNRAGEGSMPSYQVVSDYINTLAEKGCVDGISHTAKNWVDGFPPEIEAEIYQLVRSFC